MKEKRATPRVKESFPVKISKGSKTYQAVSCDISLGGLACNSPVPLPVATPVRVDLILPDPKSSSSRREIICQAKVVRSEPPAGADNKDYRLAFGFDQMSEKAREILEAFIFRRLPLPPLGEGGVKTETADIFAHGISCKSETYIPPFHEVQIQVSIPSPNSSEEAMGDRYNVDLYFTDICQPDLKLLRKFLKRPSSAKV